jgi:glycosyltransferase involved in cell wall biosynthesis
MDRITCIIPAFNEAPRILDVLKPLQGASQIHDILVVDDGSLDDTCAVVQAYLPQDPRVSLFHLRQNSGKGAAFFHGVEHSTGELILMLDADLIGFHTSHIDILIQPVLAGDCDMTIGLFKGGEWKTDLSHKATPWLSGQRCLRRELLSGISHPAARGYGLEVALSAAARLQGMKTLYVSLPGVSHPVSEVHRGSPVKGFFHRLNMYGDILRAVAITRQERRHSRVRRA